MSDYYFHKWKVVLIELKNHAKLDLDYQETKVYDQRCCEAVQRLGSVLSKYLYLYNCSVDCLQENLQVQKTDYIQNIVNAITARILELKHQLRKLEDVPAKLIRSKQVQAVIDHIMSKAKEEKETCLEEVAEEEKLSPINSFLRFWKNDSEIDEVEKEQSEIVPQLSEESLKRREMLKLIQAHERTRQVIRSDTRRIFKRDKWERELKGTSKPQARFEVKERAATIIKKVFRMYFEIKRRRFRQFKIDEMIGFNHGGKPNYVEKLKHDTIRNQRLDKQKQYKEESLSNMEAIENSYLKQTEHNIADDYRDLIRGWFKKWYAEVKFFYDIPKEELGGSSLIIKEMVPTPFEWREEYEAYLQEKKLNKSKTSAQRKFEKQEAKKEQMKVKKEEQRKLKMEQELIKKMFKNPKLHPGFCYPMSKKTDNILEAIEKYKNDWNDFDTWETEGYKEGFVQAIDHDNACMNTKLKILKKVDEDMRQELQVLKCSLQSEYKRNNEKMPENMKVTQKKAKKQKVDSTISESVQEKMQELASAGYLKQNTKMKFEDFVGDFNYVGDELRCILQAAAPLCGETRFLWWEKCGEVVLGSRRLLLVGPRGSGKTLLVNILTSVNNALLFELDPANVSPDQISAEYLKQVVGSVVACARATQPAVIHLKGLHLLYCNKVPPDQKKQNLNMFTQFFVRMLFKKIHKNDPITVIGSCRDPWLTKTSKLLKNFPDVVMMPHTTYTTVSFILRKWMADNRVVPRDLNTQSIAHLLQEYTFGHIKNALDCFLTPDNIIKIAAYGLTPQEVLDHVTQNEDEDKVDFKKYHDWYNENTLWGKREVNRLQDDKDFLLLQQKYIEKQKKREIAEKNQTPTTIEE
ncbi:PREDICTED: IQ and AAA domain-containing protein 1-like isoform X2 [Papilio polytes]|uniref:IQ and AAA domain-containing protein 1-like isoform X2 n=1 Tax=Papilio polytes TaxID=76194 RepID=UPI000676309C|nr:PREDICTED: IQ and AAA domain-containing protein 1-like isoform X2 [Papilio polytes]